MSTPSTTLTHPQRDRAIGVLVGMAAGDALGAGYEFDPPMETGQPVGMIGGGLGPFAPGEWTDDTSMAVAIVEIAATCAELSAEKSLDYIVERWHWWAQGAKDVGAQTSAVLRAAARKGICARAARSVSAEQHRHTGRSAGNGSLMRTAPVALAYLHDEEALASAAREISELTHFDPDAGDACVLWCAAIRNAVVTGGLDVRIGLRHIDARRRDLWQRRLSDAEQSQPSDYAADNGWVVAALQAAWSSIITTPTPTENPASEVFRADHLRIALEAAVRGGGDTDTVAAIAGGLLGAVHGVSAVPWQWRLVLKGWPGLNTRGLVRLAESVINGGGTDRLAYSYPSWRREHPEPKRLPRDEKIWLGAAPSLRNLPRGVDAVISLCPVPDGNIPHSVAQLDVRLIDEVGANRNLDFVLLDTVRAIEGLRAEGHTVFVHCANGQNRSPVVAALYSARRSSLDVFEALFELCDIAPDIGPNRELRAALRRLQPRLNSPAGGNTPALQGSSRRRVPDESSAWRPYLAALFPSPPASEFHKWKRYTTGANIARRYWEQREYLRRNYESVFGEDRGLWPSRHPGVVLDAVPSTRHAACLGCQWFEPHGRDPLESARRHEMSRGDFVGEKNAKPAISEVPPSTPAASTAVRRDHAPSVLNVAPRYRTGRPRRGPHGRAVHYDD
ncbi:ADP-ribosylglycohydrolase family protein [Mycolicibacterium vaccae]|uniref:ADP-ribosylglycohydrolase family protein n=1 Tax=Mycolicibacterium vaccae TaxID=1810 RepID=UPI003D01E7E9